MIVYASRTGNVRSVIGKLGLPSLEITNDLRLKEPFLLFTYTDGLGSVPMQVEKFMVSNAQSCQGILVSGNRNFGHEMFGKAGETLAAKYSVPLFAKLDLRGTNKDYEQIRLCYQRIFQSK